MKQLAAAFAVSLPLGLTPALAQESAVDPSVTVPVSRGGSRAPSAGPAAYFTGQVRVDPLYPAQAPARGSGAYVTFEPGARSAWHTHPLGQTLVVTAGHGKVQFWGGPVADIRPGDVDWIPPGRKHWHGAAPDSPMTHIAIQEQLDGKVVDWLEKVSDEQYQAARNGS